MNHTRTRIRRSDGRLNRQPLTAGGCPPGLVDGRPPLPAPLSGCLGRVAADSRDGPPTRRAHSQTQFQATAVSPIEPTPRNTRTATGDMSSHRSAARCDIGGGTPDAPTLPGCAHHRLSNPAQTPPGRWRRIRCPHQRCHAHMAAVDGFRVRGLVGSNLSCDRVALVELTIDPDNATSNPNCLPTQRLAPTRRSGG